METRHSVILSLMVAVLEHTIIFLLQMGGAEVVVVVVLVAPTPKMGGAEQQGRDTTAVMEGFWVEQIMRAGVVGVLVRQERMQQHKPVVMVEMVTPATLVEWQRITAAAAAAASEMGQVLSVLADKGGAKMA